MQYAHKRKMHRPKGSMCTQCVHASRDCSGLDFKHMPAIGKDRDGTIIVRCVAYEKDAFLDYLATLQKVSVTFDA